MERNKIIERVYNDPFFVDYINGLVTPNNREELHSEFILKVCEIPEEKLLQLNQFNELRYYCIRIIYNIITHPSSDYRKENLINIDSIEYKATTEEDIQEGEDIINDIRAFMRGRSERVEGAWADEILFDKYIMEGRTYRQIAAETGIHYVSLFKSMKLIKSMLKTKFKCK